MSIGLLILFLPDGYAILMKPNKAETAVHGCHCPSDMALSMRKVLARLMWKMYNKTIIEFGFRMISWIIISLR